MLFVAQRAVKTQLVDQATEKVVQPVKRKTMTVFSKPYFKDADGSVSSPDSWTSCVTRLQSSGSLAALIERWLISGKSLENSELVSGMF